MTEEIWKPIKGYEGRYEVSNLGRVRSLSLGLIGGRTAHLHTGRVLKAYINKDGYEVVDLYYESKKKRHHLVARLVGEAFVPNPENLPQINHKDEDRRNNHADNLEWCTARYNLMYNDRSKRVAIKQGRKVQQLSMDGDLIAEYNSIHEAARATNGRAASIQSAIVHREGAQQSGGYRWRYKE